MGSTIEAIQDLFCATLIFHTRVVNNTVVDNLVNTVYTGKGGLGHGSEQFTYGFIKF